MCWFTSTVMVRFKSAYCLRVVYWLNGVRTIDQAIYSSRYGLYTERGSCDHANPFSGDP